MPHSSYALHLADAFSDPDRGEQFRKEIFRALGERLEGLRALRKKITLAGVPVETETEVDRMIRSYQGPDGLLVLFMDETDANATVGQTKKDHRQLDWTETRRSDDSDTIATAQEARKIPVSDIVFAPPLPSHIAEALNYVRLHPTLRNMDPGLVRKALGEYSKNDVLTIVGYFLALQSAAPGVTPRVPEVIDDLVATVVGWQEDSKRIGADNGRVEADLITEEFGTVDYPD
jgi:hypothetical protein